MSDDEEDLGGDVPIEALSIRSDLLVEGETQRWLTRLAEFTELLQRYEVTEAMDIACKRWGVSPKEANAVRDALYARMREVYDDPDYARRQRHTIRNMLYKHKRDAEDAGRLGETRLTIVELGKLDGCYEPELHRAEVNVGGNVAVAHMGFHSREDMIARLRETLPALEARVLEIEDDEGEE